jgi:dTDP-L-rhamnose 4-epimerase
MSGSVLITGGGGFIGSHLADDLIAHGYKVRVIDNLSSQVHGNSRRKPEYLSPDVEFLRGDVRDREAVKHALNGVDTVVHLAAMVGVGQSMYEIASYTSVNNSGTAVLMEALVEQPVKRLVVASSMSIYGEGLYRNSAGVVTNTARRTAEQLRNGQWEIHDRTGALLTPLPTPETKVPQLTSIYALSKFDQERMCLLVGQAYDIPTVALRLFNVYGTRQSLSNPYTGVLAICASRLLNGNAPIIFEDGGQKRDFVSVYDVAQAFRLAMETPAAAGVVFNVGSGEALEVRQVATAIAEAVDSGFIRPHITGQYRVGDIRHCFADISLARRVLGYEPRVSFQTGLAELASWLRGQAAEDRVMQACSELAARGLTV